MKFSEAIERLEKSNNTDRKFESEHDGHTLYLGRNKNGSITISTQGYLSVEISLNRDWKEVKKPVTWQEAVEAWANHKRVRCEIDGHVCTYDWNVADKSEMVSIEDGFGISPLEIKNGKWFIEEGNDE